MDITDSKFLLKESIRRVANGAYLNNNYHNGVCYFEWGLAINPLEAGGVVGSATAEIENNLNAVAQTGNSVFLAIGEINDKRFMAIYPDADGIGEVMPWFKRKMFPTLLDLLLFVRDNIGSTGKISIEPDTITQRQHEILKSWSLNKETYTNKEVKEIVSQFRNEMIETINQLTNRLLDRIDH